jgi:hypothetical protein
MLQLIQQATGELGLAVPTLVAGSTAQDTIQQLALLNAVGYELQRQFDWQALCTEYRFTTSYLTTTGTWTTSAATVTGIPTTAALAANTWLASGTGIPQDTYIQSVDSGTQVTLTQTPTAAGTAATINFSKTKYALPSDYDRLIDRTEWDKSKHWEMLGPESPQQWQFLKSGYIATGPRLRFRVMGNYFQIWPGVTTSEYLGFEYVSKNWVSSASGTGKSSFTVDTDTCAFPDRLMVLGLKLKYWEIKGFDTTALYRDYITQLDIAKATDRGSKTLSMNPRLTEVLISANNIPDSGFGS